jgi:glycosyltransferase involved in cell wall biosynthesis
VVSWFEARSGRSRRVVSVSDSARTEVAELYGHRTDRVILNGIDLQRFHAGSERASRADFGLPADCFLALFTGRPGVHKGTDILDRVAELLPADMRIVAAVPRDYPAHRRVIKLVGLPRTALPTLYRSCDAYVLPSRWEACSVSVAEALASGLPPVLSRVGHVPRVLAAAPSLVEICPTRLDPAQFARALIMLARSEALCCRLGRDARAAAEELHDAETMLDAYSELIENVLR